MNPHADKQTFRAWLVKQLTLVRWSKASSTPPAALAYFLGVELGVLLEAIELRKIRARRQGRAKSKELLIRNDYAQIIACMPPPIHRDWLLFCKELQILPSTVLRSVIHHFLLSRERPQSIAPYWTYRGERYPSGRTPPLAKTRVTRGAEAALNHYASEWGVSQRAIVRGLVTDVLEGRLRRFRPVAFSELWGDSDRYLHPEKFETMKRTP